MIANQNLIVPHLTTALTGPLQNLERIILNNQTTIESWLEMPGEMFKCPFMLQLIYEIQVIK